MPKSNFNQFLDECEHFKTSENKTISKISFETKPHREHEGEDQDKNRTVTSANYNAASASSSNTFSSNIFLSNNANGQGQNRFTTKKLNSNSNSNNSSNSSNIYHNENTRNTRTENNHNNHNMFRKMDANQDIKQRPREFQGFCALSPSPSPSPSASHIVEINNETFPSLVSTSVSSTTTNTVVPKKFKNFKDAICASAPEPVVSPTKQKQLKAMAALKQSSATHHPTSFAIKAVKKDSEIYAKKILAKTKNIGYDDDEDDGDYDVDDNNKNNEEFLYKSHYKQNFIKRRCGNDSDDSDD